MIASLSLILLCQLAGEVIVRGLGLPMPGPVVGLLFLLLLLLARDRFVALARGPLQQDGVENASRGLLAHLSLLFVPAGVGVVQKLDLVAEHGIAVAAVLADLRGGDLAGDGGDVSGRESLDVARTERAMSANPFSLWVYLSQSPLLWLTVTLLVYATTDALSLKTHRHPLANPVLHLDLDHRGVPDAHGHIVHDLFRRRAVRALPARAGDRGAGGAALRKPQGGGGGDPADAGGPRGGPVTAVVSWCC
jgi:putative effector of murein hydrolase LrgA (UPF0299 family)